MRLSSFVPGRIRLLLSTMIEFVTRGNSTVRSQWVRRPESFDGGELCIFVSYAPRGVVPPYSLFHARAWADAGFRVIIVMNTNEVDSDLRMADFDFASGVLIRENRGYDFGAWATALHQLPDIKRVSLLALVNDSMFGPMDSFGALLQRVRATHADVIGMTENMEFGRHLQSFLIFFKARALNSQVFWTFWRRVRAGGRFIAIYRYEIRQLKILERAGLRCAALFPASDCRNPTLTRWRSLIDEGFPYVKVGLLRDNPFDADVRGWQTVLEDHGYDPALVVQQLGSASATLRS